MSVIPHAWRQSIGLALICLMLGLIVTLQMKTQAKVQLTLRETRVTEDMVAQFLQVSQERDLLRAELYRLQELASLQATAARLEEELQLELASAGLLEVKGPGVTVTLADLSDTSARQVTADDVMLVLNELRAGGAEAIAINGERVTARLRVARDRLAAVAPLRINDLHITGPVEIMAVGDPGTLVASLNMRGGVVSFLTPWLHIDVQTNDELIIPAAAEPVYEFAQPLR